VSFQPLANRVYQCPQSHKRRGDVVSWVDFNRESIARRYDRLAPYIKLFEWLLWLPAGLRRKAVDALALRAGERVMEIGCGTGRNLRLLRDAVGPAGAVYGVDLSEGMLAKARALGAAEGWTNVSLVRSEALVYSAPEPLDGVLFSLSYNTMPHHREVLQHALTQLRPGGRVVIMDAKLPAGTFGRGLTPFSIWLMRRTFLGNPLIRPWEHLAAETLGFEMRTCLFDSYYICRGTKPPAQPASATSATSVEAAL
jgi:demethylmenaquinone methyltransferase/2-methoxy-6-polyprenyl-1,4-benzoquinol methylase